MKRLLRPAVMWIAAFSVAISAHGADQRKPGKWKPGPDAREDGMPLTLRIPPAEYPAWIDSRAVLNPDGTPNRKYISKEGVRALEEISRYPVANGCRQVGPIFVSYYNPPSRDTIESAVETADFIALGRVSRKSYGLYAGAPGQLIEIMPERVFKGSTSTRAYYAFIPIAEFKLGEERICKTDPAYAKPPEVGEEVFAFTYSPSGDEGNLLRIQSPGDLITVSTGGALSLPRQYSDVNRGAAVQRAQIAATKESLIRTIEDKAADR